MTDHDEIWQHDGASYVDAATLALRLSAVALGPTAAPATPPAVVPPVDGTRMREVMGTLVTGVCVLTAVWEGDDVAMTANSVSSVSLDPPLVLTCVARSARFHRAITTVDVWGISILDSSAADLSRRFAKPGRDRRDQLHGLEHHRGEVTGVPLMDSSSAALECRTEAVYPGGDHSIVVARVVATEMALERADPLVFHRGTYRWLSEVKDADPAS